MRQPTEAGPGGGSFEGGMPPTLAACTTLQPTHDHTCHMCWKRACAVRVLIDLSTSTGKALSPQLSAAETRRPSNRSSHDRPRARLARHPRADAGVTAALHWATTPTDSTPTPDTPARPLRCPLADPTRTSRMSPTAPDHAYTSGPQPRASTRRGCLRPPEAIVE